MLTLFQQHPMVLWSALASVPLIIIAIVVAAIVIVHLPADTAQHPPKSRGAWRIARNIAGWLFILAGLAMLLLPGPGGIMLALGIVLADFPGKPKVQRWLLSRRAVLTPANRLRAKFHKPPLKAPGPPASGHERAVASPT
jgi:hypothetical protein